MVTDMVVIFLFSLSLLISDSTFGEDGTGMYMYTFMQCIIHIIHHKQFPIHHTPYIVCHTPYIVYHTPNTIHNSHTPYTIHHTQFPIHHTSYTIHNKPGAFLDSILQIVLSVVAGVVLGLVMPIVIFGWDHYVEKNVFYKRELVKHTQVLLFLLVCFLLFVVGQFPRSYIDPLITR